MPHAETLRAYSDANFPYTKTSHDLAEEEFQKWSDLSGRNPITVVNHITRVKVQKQNAKAADEFLTWGETRIGYDHVGNERTFTEDRMGTYIIPIFNKNWDTRTNRVQAISITKRDIRYDTPFTVEKLRELYSKADKVSVKFYVRSGTFRYLIREYDDFEQGRYEDLLEIGRSDKVSSLQELLNSRQQMVPASLVENLDKNVIRERKYRKEEVVS